MTDTLPDGTTADDTVLPFQVEGLDVRGRVVRLGPAIDTILNRHNYPAPVSKLLAEAVALTALLGSALKFQGRFQLQTRSDGPVSMIIVDYDAPENVRACARFNAEQVAAAATDGRATTNLLLGNGHMAMTIDPGGDMKQYQGVVPLMNGSLEDAAHHYFDMSEQIPTKVRLAVAEAWNQQDGGPAHSWRAGGLIVQFLPAAGENVPMKELPPGDVPEGMELPETEQAGNDAWMEAHSLAATVEDHELIDPALSSEQLLFRLFHERGVRVFDPQRIIEKCHCSEERVRDMLLSFSEDDKRHMADGKGMIGVTCDFCSTHYSFTLKDVLGDAGTQGGA
jgi:molecular chaperone Hsp33